MLVGRSCRTVISVASSETNDFMTRERRRWGRLRSGGARGSGIVFFSACSKSLRTSLNAITDDRDNGDIVGIKADGADNGDAAPRSNGLNALSRAEGDLTGENTNGGNRSSRSNI